MSEVAMSSEEVLARLSEIASGDLFDYMEVTPDGGWTVNLRKAKRRGRTKLLKKIRATKDGPEIEIHSPLEALEKLGRYHGLFKDVVKDDGRDRDSTERKEIEIPADDPRYQTPEDRHATEEGH